MIGVNSYTELFTMPVAWEQYVRFWDILSVTGIVLLPFFKIMLSNLSSGLLANRLEDAASPILRKTILEIIVMLIVVMIGVIPIIELDQAVLDYSQAKKTGKNGVIANINHTTFHQAINVPNHVKVPLLHFAVMSISYGLTHHMISGLEYKQNLRQVHVDLNTSSIHDGALRAEISLFYNQCWKPSYAKYIKSQSDFDKSQYEIDDVNWLGSHYFLEKQGFYDTYYAHQPIKNFTSSAIDNGFDYEFSRPYCKFWWNDSINGLRTRISKELPKSFIKRVSDYVDRSLITNEKGIRRLIEVSFPEGLDSLADSHWHGRHHFTKSFSSKAGMFMESFSAYPKMHVIITALPVIQALLLAGIIIALPIYSILSGYSLKAILLASAAIGSIILWSLWWELANMLDNVLIQAFYPTSYLEVGGTNSLGEYVVDLASMFMYIVFPLVFGALMSLAGWYSGQSLSGFISQSTSSVSGAGDKAGQLTSVGALGGKKMLTK